MNQIHSIAKSILCMLSILVVVSCSGTSPKDSAPSTRQNPKEADANKQPAEFRGVVINQAGGQLYQPTSTQSLDLPPRVISSDNENSIGNEDSGSVGYTVLPIIDGARIVSEGNRQWVEVDTHKNAAWEIMEEFWKNSGIGLVENNPETGMMETEWIQSPKDVTEARSVAMRFARSLVTSLTQRETVLHQFRIHFEQPKANNTHIHVSHRWVARKEREKARKVSEFKWTELPSDRERVADFLQNIVLLFDQSAISP